jgi:hypothetical protein
LVLVLLVAAAVTVTIWFEVCIMMYSFSTHSSPFGGCCELNPFRLRISNFFLNRGSPSCVEQMKRKRRLLFSRNRRVPTQLQCENFYFNQLQAVDLAAPIPCAIQVCGTLKVFLVAAYSITLFHFNNIFSLSLPERCRCRFRCP